MAKIVKNETTDTPSILDCARLALAADKDASNQRMELEMGLWDVNAKQDSAYAVLAEAIDTTAPATPLVASDATIRDLGKFVEKYGQHPTFRDNPVMHFQNAMAANSDLEAAHTESGIGREFRQWKQSVMQNTAYWAGKSGWTQRGRDAAEALGLTEGDAIINPTLDPEAIKAEEIKAEQKAEAKKARDAYKKMPMGEQIAEDMQALHNRLTVYHNALLDAEGITGASADAALALVDEVRETLSELQDKIASAPAFNGKIKIKVK